MAKAIEYLQGARKDFDEPFDWYAERSVGAAVGFASAVDDALDTILADPGRFPSTHGGCAYCALKRYPFRIVFRNEPDGWSWLPSLMRNVGPDSGTIGHRADPDYRSRNTSS